MALRLPPGWQKQVRIYLNGRNQTTIERAQAKLAEAGIEAQCLCCDVANAEEVDTAIDAYEADKGAIDILINNAGIQHRAELAEFTDEDFNRVMATNSHAVFYTAKGAVGKLVTRPWQDYQYCLCDGCCSPECCCLCYLKSGCWRAHTRTGDRMGQWG